MRTVQVATRGHTPDADALAPLRALDPHLVLVFAGRERMDDALGAALAAALPQARSVGCSTCGEIGGTSVDSDSVVVTGIRFDDPDLHTAATEVADIPDSFAAGVRLGRALPAGLRGVLLFGPGVAVNGSALVEGLRSVLGDAVPLSGGLAGDDANFVRTRVLLDGKVGDRTAAAVGFRSPRIRLTHGSFGGWRPFGPVRRVTKCDGNVLHALDDEPALEVYRRYLGDHAAALPTSGLLFPFALLDGQHDQTGLIRTILGIDEATGSLVLAGDLVRDGHVRLMHASTDGLVDGAHSAAAAARPDEPGDDPALALLVSCVGRKLVMGGRVDEEVEAVAEVLGSGATLAGFYSHGEIAPFSARGGDPRLHNQTMTITLLREVAG